MPIVTRNLVRLANREDLGAGVKRWRVDGIDHAGGNWVHGPFSGTRAEAEAIRDGCWTSAQLQDAEERRGIEFITAGGAPESFARGDLTLTEWRRRVARRFWRGTLETDRKFLEKVAPYLAGFGAAQIAAALGISEQRAQLGLDKAILIRDSLADDMAAFDGAAEDV